MEELKKEITKEGVRLTHPSGVIQILTVESLEKLKEQMEEQRAHITRQLVDLAKDLDAVRAEQEK